MLEHRLQSSSPVGKGGILLQGKTFLQGVLLLNQEHRKSQATGLTTLLAVGLGK